MKYSRLKEAQVLIFLVLLGFSLIGTHTYFTYNKAIEANLGSSVGASLAFNEVQQVSFPDMTRQHNGYIDGTIGQTFRYRILVPLLAEGVRNILGVQVHTAYTLLHLAFLFISYCVFYMTMRIWFNRTLSLFGCSLVAVLLPLTYILWMPNDMFGFLTYIFATFFLVKGLKPFENNLAYWIVILIGTFNKEITAFLVLAYAVFRFWKFPNKWMHNIIYSGICGLCFAVPYFSLRIIMGTGAYTGLGVILNFLVIGAILLFAFFSGLLPMAVSDWGKKPAELRALAWLFIPHLAVTWFLGDPGEVRLYLPLLTWMIPMALWYMRDTDARFVEN